MRAPTWSLGSAQDGATGVGITLAGGRGEIMSFLSPGLVLAVALVLIATQAVQVIRPHGRHYVWSLVLSTAGLIMGELVATAVHSGGPALGVLHPLSDLIAIGVLQVASIMVTERERVV